MLNLDYFKNDEEKVDGSWSFVFAKDAKDIMDWEEK